MTRLPPQAEANKDFFDRSKEEWAAMGGFPRTCLEAAIQQYGDWRMKLAPGSGGFLGDERNILLALRFAPELRELTRFNAFALQIEFVRSPPWRELEPGTRCTDSDYTQLMAWLQAHDIRVRNASAVADCVGVVANENTVHPLRNYLDGLTWDQVPRLQIWLAEYLDARGDPVYLGTVGAKFLISAVARAYKPGCQADHTLVLEGPQGSGRTSTARILAVHPEWFAGSLPEIHTKDAPLQLCGRWIIEIAELKAIRTSQIEATKSFLTQCVDTFRPPYARHTGQFARQCVFIGTTNESEYLRDRTGNRRYWPVRCGHIDLGALQRDRDQLWAQAVHEFRQGLAWHLTPEETTLAEACQRERVYVSETEQDVAAYLATVTENEVTVRDVLTYGLQLDPTKPTYVETPRKVGAAVAEALERCGWRKVARMGRAENRRTVYRRLYQV
jgi:predicted P-loop ATPase